MPAQTFQLNSAVTQNLHAKLVTEEKRNMDGATLLKNALEGVDPIRQLVKVSLVSPEPTIVDEGGRRGKGESDMVTLRYAFKFEIDKDRYMSEFLPHIQKTFEQISVKPAKTVRLSAGPTHHVTRKRRSRGGTNELMPYEYRYIDNVDLSVRVNGFDIATSGNTKFFRRPKVVAIMTEVGKNANFAKAVVCELDEASGDEVARWQRLVSLGSPDRDYGDRLLTYNAVISGKDGSDICVVPIRISASDLNPVCTRLSGYTSPQLFMMITPFVAAYAESYCKSIDCKIPKDELPNVANITIELAE
jgi:hypothetical protein